MRNNMGGDGNGVPRVPRRSEEAALHSVPKWEELLANPSRAWVVDVRTAPMVAAKALGLFSAAIYCLIEAAGPTETDDNQNGPPASRNGPASGSRALPSLDDVVSVEEVVAILGKSRRWIVRNAASLPFVMRVSRKHFVCSRIALRRWLATRPHSLKGS